MKKLIMYNKFIVLDSTNHLLRSFSTYQEANEFRIVNGRYDWTIISTAKSTERQKAAISFCEEILSITFKGNIDSKEDCSKFLSEYLQIAKQFYTELKCKYETDRGY